MNKTVTILGKKTKLVWIISSLLFGLFYFDIDGFLVDNISALEENETYEIFSAFILHILFSCSWLIIFILKVDLKNVFFPSELTTFSGLTGLLVSVGIIFKGIIAYFQTDITIHFGEIVISSILTLASTTIIYTLIGGFFHIICMIIYKLK